jgi:hypothetical protein
VGQAAQQGQIPFNHSRFAQVGVATGYNNISFNRAVDLGVTAKHGQVSGDFGGSRYGQITAKDHHVAINRFFSIQGQVAAEDYLTSFIGSLSESGRGGKD